MTVALADRLASVSARLAVAMGEPLMFRAASVSALIDRSPKPDRLPIKLLDLDSGAQAVLIVLPGTIEPAPRPEEYLTAPGVRYRIQSVRTLGHAYELACILSLT